MNFCLSYIAKHLHNMAFFLLCCFAASLYAAGSNSTPASYALNTAKYDFIDTSLNVIQFPQGNESFEPFFKKLDTLVFENKGQIRILHIGGSHLQADIISGRIRDRLVKEFPGASAGRGFIFPYSAAHTNTPATYGSYYKGIWEANKNIQKRITMPLGLLGIAVSTQDPRAEIKLLLDKYNFSPMWSESKIRLFGYSDNNDVIPVLRVGNADIQGEFDPASQSYLFSPPRPIDSIRIQFRWVDTLQQESIAKYIADSLSKDSILRTNMDSSQKEGIPSDSMFLGECDVLDTACLSKDEISDKNSTREQGQENIAKAPRPRFTITGILTESNHAGVSYTNVGINGARVRNYFEKTCPQFEKELEFYKPDLVIFAIGINDANVEIFNDKQFRDDYDQLIARIKNVNPNVAIVFETNNDSFRRVGKKQLVLHPNGEVARRSFFMLAQKHGAGVWDKFSIMGGLGSMEKWEKSNLAKNDRVHFRTAGYQLLGDMFYKALIRAYQEHIANLPAIEP